MNDRLESSDTEEFCSDCMAGMESSEHHEKCVRPVGYVIAERHVYGPHKGRLDVDWDGLVHEDRASAEAELARANAPLSDDPTETPDDHWKLYELREVQP